MPHCGKRLSRALAGGKHCKGWRKECGARARKPTHVVPLVPVCRAGLRGPGKERVGARHIVGVARAACTDILLQQRHARDAQQQNAHQQRPRSRPHQAPVDSAKRKKPHHTQNSPSSWGWRLCSGHRPESSTRPRLTTSKRNAASCASAVPSKTVPVSTSTAPSTSSRCRGCTADDGCVQRHGHHSASTALQPEHRYRLFHAKPGWFARADRLVAMILRGIPVAQCQVRREPQCPHRYQWQLPTRRVPCAMSCARKYHSAATRM